MIAKWFESKFESNLSWINQSIRYWLYAGAYFCLNNSNWIIVFLKTLLLKSLRYEWIWICLPSLPFPSHSSSESVKVSLNWVKEQSCQMVCNKCNTGLDLFVWIECSLLMWRPYVYWLVVISTKYLYLTWVVF